MEQSNHGGPLTAVIIDDDEAHLDLVRRAVQTALVAETGLVILAYSDASAALAELPVEGRVVILCDYLLNGASGVDWIPDFMRSDVGPVIIMTSSGDEQIAVEAFRQGAADYLDKSLAIENPETLRFAIIEAMRRFTLERTNRELARRLKLTNRELQRKNETLAELTDTAHRFVDDVAHEFRTPLAVIAEFAAIIADGLGGEVTPKQHEFLKYISTASSDLAGLVDDFLDSGKLRARTLRVERAEYAVDDLLDAPWTTLVSRASARSVDLERIVESGLPGVYADREKFGRTLINLVVNAVKFSPPGETVTVAASRSSCGGVRFAITDRGPGLSEDEANRLFERFQQGAGSERISSKGFGLGLSIVRELVAINLGTVSVDSVLGSGSTFGFTLAPAENGAIVEAFLRRATERSPDAQITLLCASRETPSDDELMEFIASTCHATDIQIPSTDGRSVIVAGETIEYENWCRRLEELDEARVGVRLGPLRTQHLGTWSLERARTAILEHIDASAEVQRRA